MTVNEAHALKTKRSKVCEQQGIDTDKDPICIDLRKDMDQLEQEIYSTIDSL